MQYGLNAILKTFPAKNKIQYMIFWFISLSNKGKFEDFHRLNKLHQDRC